MALGLHIYDQDYSQVDREETPEENILFYSGPGTVWGSSYTLHYLWCFPRVVGVR